MALTLQRMPDFREQGLTLFEQLLELDLYGARGALDEIDLAKRYLLDRAPLEIRSPILPCDSGHARMAIRIKPHGVCRDRLEARSAMGPRRARRNGEPAQEALL